VENVDRVAIVDNARVAGGVESVEALKSRFSRFKNDEFRAQQLEALDFIRNSDRLVNVICAPTGSGKSLVGMVAGASCDRLLYLCSSKQLQSQLAQEFPEAEVMWGRQNFKCNLRPHRTADLCTHNPRTKPCSMRKICDYEVHKEKVRNARYQILNYSYFLTEANYVGIFSDYPIIVCDEADAFEAILTNFINLSFSGNVLEQLKLGEPAYRTAQAKHGIESWIEWAGRAAKKIQERLNDVEKEMVIEDEEIDEYEDLLKERRRLASLLQRIETFLDNVSGTWVLNIKETSGQAKAFEFKPTWLTRELTDAFFFRHGDRFVFMSATFPKPIKVLGKLLSLDVSEMNYLELDSGFPVESRRVYLRSRHVLQEPGERNQAPALGDTGDP
jgi:Rad3-related DNA helicase